MRIRYLVKFEKPIRLEDHWPISVFGGQLRIVTEGRLATGLEVMFTDQSVNLAPASERHDIGEGKATITIRDNLILFVRMQLEAAFTFLQCHFDVDILIDEIEHSYEAESPEEEEQIKIKKYSKNKAEIPLQLPYDLFTRALMAAEFGPAPDFEVTLVRAARTAMKEKKYIDSFRYAFLLIESLYGEGRFKSAQLKAALRASTELKEMVERAIRERLRPKRPGNSDTEQLLAQSPAAEVVVDHLVDKRGFYFHGNRKRKDAWQPHQQDAAEALCLLTLEVALQIAHEAAAPMFDEAFSQRHFEDAERVGAIMTMQVKFEYQEPADDLPRTATMNIRVPGTKATPKMATYVLKAFLERFEHVTPVADLRSATCTVNDTEQPVFELVLHGD